MNTYHITPKIPGYGWRIWIKEEAMTPAIEKRMKYLSLWMGMDKRHDGEVSWEFNDDGFKQAIAFLKGSSFTEAES